VRNSGDFSKEKSFEKLKEISDENLSRTLIVEFSRETKMILTIGIERDFHLRILLRNSIDSQERKLYMIFP
jgi:hypothetical protein